MPDARNIEGSQDTASGTVGAGSPPGGIDDRGLPPGGSAAEGRRGLIDEVVARLDLIIINAIAESSRIGLFAAMYRQVTVRVQQAIAAGFFEDGPRMDRLDTVFATRYLDALATWQAGGAPTRSWQVTFDASRRADLIILQHLLLGMNAHINLDLAIAAATVCPGDALPALHTDFQRINQILADTLNEFEAALAQVSPLLKLLTRFGDAAEDAIANFSIRAARDDAWQHAALLAVETPDQQRQTVSIIDTKIAFLGRLIAEPGRTLTVMLDAINLEESTDIPAIIRALSGTG
jgi:hypothetical protein